MSMLPTPFHSGELAVQDRMGVREQVHSYAPKFVRSFLPDQHRDLLESLPFIIVGSIDDQQQPTASIIFGFPGFINAPDDQTVRFDTHVIDGDPLAENLVVGTPLGFLAIEFETRRRNRMNGKVSNVDHDGFEIRLDQTFGNCPQYIQSRSLSYEAFDPRSPEPTIVSESLASADLRERLAAADTFFIASSHFEDDADEKHGVDVSHRGGKPGFLQFKDGVLTFPDFSGNNHFNTIGNIVLNPKVGILLPDFENGDLLLIHGEASIIWDGPQVDAFEGAQRLISVHITSTRLIENAMPNNWRFHDYSPSLQYTGTFDQMGPQEDAHLWRDLRVDRIERESSVINSFYLTPLDDKPIEDYLAGQHLPIRLKNKPRAIRTYTISKAACGGQYRLSIKREEKGDVSRYFHDDLRVGDTLEAMSPRGAFHQLQTQEKPVLLVSGGVGITPMIAMLEALVNTHGCTSGKKTEQPIVFIHAARNGDEHAFKSHPILGAAADLGVQVFYAYSEPTPQDIIDQHFSKRGRLDRDTLANLLPSPDSDVFLCGPLGFMEAMRAHYADLGVPDSQIQQEVFGAPKSEQTDAPDIEVPVTLHTSNKHLTWNPSKSSILDLAEEASIDAPFSCRGGSCGTCLTKILKGSVRHPTGTQYDARKDEALICCALPDEDASDPLVLDL